jgi:hypothetical protein
MLRNTRNRIGIYLAIGTLAAGGIALTSEKQVESENLAPKYSLEMVFLIHTGSENADIFIKEIDSAKEKGKPYDIIFAENYESEESMDWVTLNKKMETIRSSYEDKLSQGLSPQASEDYTLAHTSMSSNEFHHKILIHAAINGIIFLPIEVYNKARQAQILDTGNLTPEFTRQVQSLMDDQNPTLGEVKDAFQKYFTSFSEVNSVREKNIVTGIQTRFDTALNQFPQLKEKRSKGETITAISYMGSAHRHIFSEISQTNDQILFEPPKIYRGEESKLLGVSILDSTMTGGVPDERKCYLAALGVFGVDNLIAVSEKASPELATKISKAAMSITEEELVDLDKQTSTISDKKFRREYVLNYVVIKASQMGL